MNKVINTAIKRDYLFTSESVAEGHPDKICDQISDTIVDLYLTEDPYARVAVETMVTPSKVIIAGEVRGPDSVTPEIIEQSARQLIKYIGYEQNLFHWEKIDFEILLNRQSPDIAMGVDSSDTKDEGAGDQGIMFGFACNETENLMPAPIYYAHKILENISKAIHQKEISGLGPDAKSQVTLFYKQGLPVKATSIVVSIQHHKSLSQSQVKELIRPYIVSAFPNPSWICDEDNIFVNPTGMFIIGGPESDTGVTGRKIIVDTYGGAAPHGGGAFSGKDPTKVDRSAAYAARYLAKNVVAADLAEKCTIQISYAIGIAKPLSFYVNTHGTGKISEERLATLLQNTMDLSPRSLREHLKLNKPIYQKTAVYGHFGRAPEANGCFSWEKIDLVEKLKSH
jgi:S-adenosylmethionine synthetase